MSTSKSRPGKRNHWGFYKKRIAGEVDTRQRNEIAIDYYNLVRSVAYGMLEESSVPYEDLEQIGMMGCLKAVERFDPTKGVDFSSFAVPYIRGAIMHYLRDNGSTVKVPRRMRELNSRANRVERTWSLMHGCTTAPDEVIADELQVSVQKIRDARKAVYHQYACPLEEEHDCPCPPTPEVYATDQEQLGRLEQTWSTLRTKLTKLPTIEQQMLEMLFVRKLNQKAVAKLYNMSSEQLNQKVASIFSKLA